MQLYRHNNVKNDKSLQLQRTIGHSEIMAQPYLAHCESVHWSVSLYGVLSLRRSLVLTDPKSPSHYLTPRGSKVINNSQRMASRLLLINSCIWTQYLWIYRVLHAQFKLLKWGVHVQNPVNANPEIEIKFGIRPSKGSPFYILILCVHSSITISSQEKWN